MLRHVSHFKRAAITLLLTVLLLLFVSLRRLSANPFRPATKQAPIEAETDAGPDYWEWETSTRFRTPHAIGPNTTSEDVCASFPTDVLPRIQIVLKTGATEPAERIETHLSSVTRCISNLLIASDREDVRHGHRVHDVLADLRASSRVKSKDFEVYDALHRGDVHVDGADGWKLDRFKFFPMIERAKETNPGADWFVFLETDTYFVWDNLFRLLDQFDPSVPRYMGSPAPGRKQSNGETVWFAFGGAGIVLSKAGVDRLLEPEWPFFQSSPSLRHYGEVSGDCCGDSILGSVLYDKGVKLSGMWPMFNPHPLHGIPFEEAQWCQPVITTHKSFPGDIAGLAEWENRRNRTTPLLYSDLSQFLGLGYLDEKEDWDNGNWGGVEAPPESPAQSSFEACQTACHEHDTCHSFTYDFAGHCIFVPSIRLGAPTTPSNTTKLSAGWDNEKIQQWRDSHPCEQPLWMKPSVTRIF